VSRLRAALGALRPAQWLKNAPVLAGIVFGRRIGDGAAVRHVATTLVAFCLVASAGYLVNDVVDVEADRAHPLRRRRAIAEGRLPVRAALVLAAALALAAAGLATFVPTGARLDLLAYAALTLAYTFLLRRAAAVGVLAIAGGFVLRADVGARAAEVAPSAWLLALTGVLALAFAVGKREADARRDAGIAPRALVRATDALLALAGLGYLAYGFSPDTVALHGTRLLPLTALPVLAALARFRRRLRASTAGEGPAELIAGDRVLVALGILWAVACIVVLGLVVRTTTLTIIVRDTR